MGGKKDSKQEENNKEFADGYGDGRSGNSIKDTLIGFHDLDNQWGEGYKAGMRDREKYGWKSKDECGTGESDDDTHHGGCFLTTACVRAAGLPDDCIELTALRNFRDTYVRKLEGGEAMIQKYYALSPQIVKVIPDSELAPIYTTIQLVVTQINSGELKKAFNTYAEMFNRLCDRHLTMMPL